MVVMGTRSNPEVTERNLNEDVGRIHQRDEDLYMGSMGSRCRSSYLTDFVTMNFIPAICSPIKGLYCFILRRRSYFLV